MKFDYEIEDLKRSCHPSAIRFLHRFSDL